MDESLILGGCSYKGVRLHAIINVINYKNFKSPKEGFTVSVKKISLIQFTYFPCIISILNNKSNIFGQYLHIIFISLNF